MDIRKSREVDSAISTIEWMKDEIVSTEDKISELEDTISSMTTGHEETVSDLRDEIRILTETIGQIVQERDGLRNENLALMEKIDDLNDINKDLHSEVDELKDEIAQSK